MRRGGGGRGRPNLGTPRPLMSGSMITGQSNQLGLQDIDLELELLKRKREIIEQQQQMLRNEYSTESRFKDFSHMYEESRDFYGEGMSSSGASRKRPSVWEHESDAPPKRFTTGNNAGPRKTYSSQPQFKTQYKPKHNSQPSFQPRGQQSTFKPRPKGPAGKKKTDFNPSKVTKPSAAAPPNKLNSYAPAERQKLIATTLRHPTVPDESLILRPDREPSNQLCGRLGLGLGFIMKQIKAQFPEHEELFKNPREMKNTVRERLHVALMGKYVGSLEQINKAYRAVYPPETDREVVMKILEANSGVDYILIDSDDPEEFYTKNIKALMMRKMDDMFSELSKKYSAKLAPTSSKFIEKKAKANIAKNTSATKDTDKGSDELVTTDKISDKDTENSTEDIGENTSEIIEGTNVATEAPNDPTEANAEVQKSKAPNKCKSQEQQDILDKFASTRQYQELDRLMSANLPFMLKRFIPKILTIMKVDSKYRRSLALIRHEANRKRLGDKSQEVPTIAVDEEPEVPAEDQKEKEKDTKPNQYQPLPYFVKILGRPSLPKRKAMQSFFEKYNPKTIKKHRTVHNLLFVGFADKESFDNILTADGTEIGRYTLSIKVSDRTKKPINIPSPVKLLNAELEDQITDLLTSIKKSEGFLDDEDTNTEGDNSNEEIKEENGTTEEIEKPSNELNANEIEPKSNGIKDTKDDETNVSIKDLEADKDKGSESQTDSNADNIEKDSKTQETVNTETEKLEYEVKNEIPEANTEKVDSEVENSVTNTDNVGKLLLEDIANLENVADVTVQEKEASEEAPVETEVESEKKDSVSELKSTTNVKGTPTRTSARLAATPSTIRTRRASKLASENNS